MSDKYLSICKNTMAQKYLFQYQDIQKNFCHKMCEEKLFVVCSNLFRCCF
jgi:hypothetical protein